MITVNRALEVYKTKTALAKALGIKPQAVVQWKNVIPLKHQLMLKYEIDPTEFKDELIEI